VGGPVITFRLLGGRLTALLPRQLRHCMTVEIQVTKLLTWNFSRRFTGLEYLLG